MIRRYELIISLCCFLGMFCNIGLVSTSFNVYQPYIVALPGIGDTNGSLILAFRNLVSLVTLLFVDRYYGALDCRLGLALACLLTGSGFVAYSFASDMPLFMLGALLAGIGYGLGGMVCVTMLTNRWYRDKIGTAIGFAAVGSGVAGVVMPMVVVGIVRAISLQASFGAAAGVAFAIGALLFLLVRNKPSDLGREPFGAVRSDGGPTSDSSKRRTRAADVDLARHPASSTEKAALLAAMVCVGAMSIGGMTYIGVLLSSEGYDELFVATLLSLTGACLTAGKFATGALFDAIGTRRGSAIMFAFAIAGFAMLLLAPLGLHALSIIGAALMGIGLSLGTVGISVWSIEFSEPSDRTQMIKRYQVAYALGGLIMNALPGPLKDLTGTYLVSYALLCLAATAAAFIVLCFYTKHRVRA